MILVVDNYDSFTYNLVQYLAELGAAVEVVRNDHATVDELEAMAPEAVVISPGPGRPEDAGICVELIRRMGPRTPILGVCLGHQAIGFAYGARIVPAPDLVHGKTSLILHRGGALYEGVESPFTATRYHSLVVDRDGLPADLEVTAETVEPAAGSPQGAAGRGGGAEAPGSAARPEPAEVPASDGRGAAAETPGRTGGRGGAEDVSGAPGLVEAADPGPGLIMGLRHRRHPVEGVQYHPESILTGPGRRILANFLGKAVTSSCRTF